MAVRWSVARVPEVCPSVPVPRGIGRDEPGRWLADTGTNRDEMGEQVTCWHGSVAACKQKVSLPFKLPARSGAHE
ncbi:hypothetical protein GCM10010411_92530 [Actinomadura fulvescens]|uniref:Uncharacterized protein n=1 Tax=Actinomadura fulvescens TaxID=46160 RepID=A0ABN3QXX0_9ACTN